MADAVPTLRFLREDLDRAYDGDAWHGDALVVLLADIDAGAATARPVPGVHSVWEIVLHLASWMEVGARRVSARAALPMDEADDWPPVPERPDAAAWAGALERLGAAHRSLLAAVDGLDEADLWTPLGTRDRSQGTGGTVAYLLAGLAQHAAYHGGQVALLRKALTVPRSGGGSEAP